MKSIGAGALPFSSRRRHVRSTLRSNRNPRMSLLDGVYSNSAPDLGPAPRLTRHKTQPLPETASTEASIPSRRRFFYLRESESVYEITGKSIIRDMREATSWLLNKEKAGLRRESQLLERRLSDVVSARKALQSVALEPVSSLPARLEAFQELKRGNSHKVRTLVLQYPGLVRAVDAVPSI